MTSLKINEIIVDIENIEKIKQLEDFTYINNFLKFLPFEKRELFILEAGGLDIPKLSLNFISISYENHLILTTSSCSYFSIYYTYYFADYNFSTVSNMENIKEEKTLRGVLGNNLSKILDKKIINFINNGNLSLIPLLPNPLGVTGIINIEDRYIIRKRNKGVISELNTYDWSFSGLINSHDFLLEYYIENKKIKILKIMEKEILDELDLYKKLIDLNSYVYEIYFLGIIFNEKYLYQPELILFIRLKKEIIENFNLKSKDIKFYTIDEIKTIVIDGYKSGNKKMKNLFIIGFELLDKFLKFKN